jgi:hypothetical protein
MIAADVQAKEISASATSFGWFRIEGSFETKSVQSVRGSVE